MIIARLFNFKFGNRFYASAVLLATAGAFFNLGNVGKYYYVMFVIYSLMLLRRRWRFVEDYFLWVIGLSSTIIIALCYTLIVESYLSIDKKANVEFLKKIFDEKNFETKCEVLELICKKFKNQEDAFKFAANNDKKFRRDWIGERHIKVLEKASTHSGPIIYEAIRFDSLNSLMDTERMTYGYYFYNNEYRFVLSRKNEKIMDEAHYKIFLALMLCTEVIWIGGGGLSMMWYGHIIRSKKSRELFI